MSFEQDGFLANDRGEWINQVRHHHAPWFDFVLDLNREAMCILPRVAPSQTDDQQLIAALAFGRVLQSYQGIILLAQNGLIADARTLIRSAAETAIAIGALAMSPEFVTRLKDDDAKQRLGQAKSLLDDKVRLEQHASTEQIARLQATVAEIKARYSSGAPAKINWAQVAGEAEFRELYDLLYRPMSGDGAHLTLTALNRHFGEATASQEAFLKFGPESDELDDVMQTAATVILHAFEATNRIFPGTIEDKRIHGFLGRYENLRRNQTQIG